MVKKLNIFFFYLVGDLVLIGLSLFKESLWLINTQVAFIGSLLIVFASYFGYKGFIEGQIPFAEIEEDTDEKFSEKSKKIIGTFRGALSPLRLLSYLFLILSFFFLRRHEWFLPLAFLAGLSVVPLCTLVWILFAKKD